MSRGCGPSTCLPATHIGNARVIRRTLIRQASCPCIEGFRRVRTVGRRLVRGDFSASKGDRGRLYDVPMTTVPVGGPTLPQERRIVTEIPGPKSRDLHARKDAAVSGGIGV